MHWLIKCLQDIYNPFDINAEYSTVELADIPIILTGSYIICAADFINLTLV